METDAEAVNAIYRKFSEAVNHRNATAYGDLFAENAVVMPPNAPAVAGRAAIKDWAKRLFENWRVEADTVTVERQEADGLVAFRRWVASGRYVATATGQAVPLVQKYLDVLTKDVSGVWRFAAHMWSSNARGPSIWA